MVAGSDDEIPPPPPPTPQTPTQQAPHTVSTIKLPILKKGNGPASVSTDTNGVIKVLPPKTAKEILARERERKARTTLLMALREDHLAKFHKMTDAKDMWDAIKSRFGGSYKSKKMQKYILKFQSLLSQLEIHGAGVSTEDGNQKFLRVFESDIKGSTGSSSSAQNVAFVSSESTSSTNDVSTAYGVSTSSGYNSQRENSSSYTDELMYSFFANQSSGPHLDHEDLEQLDEFDLEEMDLKWQVVMISMRLKKFYKKTGRKLHFDAKEPVGFDKTKVECYNCHKKGHFARECRSKGNTGYKSKDNGRRPGKQEEPKALVTLDGEGVDWTDHAEDEQENFALMAYSNSGSDTEVTSCSKECVESYAKLKKLYDEQREQLGDASIEIQAYTQALKKVEAQLVTHQKNQLWYEEKIRFMKIDLDDKTDVLTYHKKLLAEAVKEKEELKTKLENFQSSSKGLSKLLNSQMSKRDKSGLGYGDQVHDGVLSYENEVFQSVFDSRSSDVEDSPVHDRFANVEGMHAVPPPMIGNYMPSGPDREVDDSMFTYGPKQSKTSESDTQTSNFDSCESNSSVETLESVPEPVVVEPKVVSQPKVWSDAPIIEEYESDSDDEYDNPQRALKNKGIVDSGCSRHMTGNKAYLAEYQDYNGGPVAFGGSKGYITGKDVYKKNKNIVPSGGLACLIAKATIDESNKWHRRFSWVFFLRTKDETSGILKDFIRQIENQLNQKVKTIRCDNGTEFKNRDIIEFCGSKWIKREYSNARTPQQNGVAERKNKTLIEAARTMLADSFLPNTFWAEAVSTACYVLNRVLVTKPQNKTPYELITGKIPIISYIRPFGCHVTILNTIDHLGKFEGKSDEGFLVGYSLNSKAFRPVRSENQANKTTGPKEANHSAGTQDNIDAGNSEMEAESAQDYFVLPIWSSYTSTIKSSEAKNEGEKPNKNTKDKIEPVDQEETSILEELESLKDKKGANDVAEALERSLPKILRICFFKQELLELPDIYDNPNDGIFTNASYDNEGAVTDLTNLETIMNVSPIPTSRIHSIHPSTQILGDPKSTVQTRSKVNKSTGAHAFGHRQEEGIDYDEVFAPVARIEAIRIFLAFASYMGFIVYQMDVKSAFLYGKINEEVYVSQPPGFIDPKFPKKVYKVVKALYGLHQAPKASYATLSTFLLKSGYRRGTIDKTLFIKKDKNDIMLVQISDEFLWGELTFFLGITSKQNEVDEEAVDVDVYLYRSMIGSLMYLTASRPDIMFVVCACSRVLSFDLEAYSDSNYAGANIDRKSTTGEYVAAANYCGQNPVFHSKTKHIEIRHHFIRDAYEKKLIQVYSSHDSPLSGDHTSEKAEGGLNLEELFFLCTNLSNRVLDLETFKDAQAAEILKLNDQIKKLKRKCKPSISHHRAWEKSGRKRGARDYIETEDVVKEGKVMKLKSLIRAVREEEASKATIAETYDEVQAGIDADALFAAKLQLKKRGVYIKERVKFLLEIIVLIKKNLELQRSAEIRTEGKDICRNSRFDDFKPMDLDDVVKDSKEVASVNKQEVLKEPNSTKVEVKQKGHEESIRKRPGRRLKMKATKKSKR
ncbi:putative ribonuclease H-like domain-containing protein [Tanacetum coccineum]|uniref:Ribonuclease H-like domain-containing protein n=1 Tax=Tanacetum coccineum TaxID=301880 RepID=A0ABQ5BXC3_9ASTR